MVLFVGFFVVVFIEGGGDVVFVGDDFCVDLDGFVGDFVVVDGDVFVFVVVGWFVVDVVFGEDFFECVVGYVGVYWLVGFV